MTQTHAYFDCMAGISGDMLLAALIDLGVPLERLQADLQQLPIGPFSLSVSTVSLNGIRARQVDIEFPDTRVERHFSDIQALIANSALPEGVKRMALKTFRRLAEAEAEVHGCALDEVHFHEVGALDAIVDIVGAALCRHYLEIDQITASPLPMGSGFVNCRHGVLPLPAPATLSLLRNVPLKGVAIEAELVTPTGAALVTEMAESFGPFPAMTLGRVGYGAGHQRFDDRPNLLRVVLGHPAVEAMRGPDILVEDRIEVIETAIDDLNPEVFGYLMERLLAIDEVLDVYWIPVYMKKNRPGTLVQVMCRAGQSQSAVEVIFNETSTLGMRLHPVRRLVLPREQSVLETSLGQVAVKRIRTPDGRERLLPEYDECRRLAQAHQLPVNEVYARITAETTAAAKRKP
jgi:uncharacterized protein (TIGR00299 family) protein